MKKQRDAKNSCLPESIRDRILASKFNDYAQATVVLGIKRPGEIVPFEKFLEGSVFAGSGARFQKKYFLTGCLLDDTCTTLNQDVNDYYRRRFFNFKMSLIFQEDPNAQTEIDYDCMFAFCDSLRDYINGCFPMFCEIAATEIENSDTDSELFVQEAKMCRSKLVGLMRNWYLKRYIEGKDISRYLEDVQYIPAYLSNLIRNDGSHYIIENACVDSEEFKLALLSLLDFESAENNVIWRKKCDKWQSDKKSASCGR